MLGLFFHRILSPEHIGTPEFENHCGIPNFGHVNVVLRIVASFVLYSWASNLAYYLESLRDSGVPLF